MNRPPTMRASGWLVWITTGWGAGVSIFVMLLVYPEKISPLVPRTSSEYFTSLEVIGTPSDHLASISLKVTVFLSGETFQLLARPGAGDRSSGLKLTSRSQLSAQTRKFSSSWATKGLSVWMSCAQPSFSTFFFSVAPPAGSAVIAATAVATVTSRATIVLSLIPISSCSLYGRLGHFQGLRGRIQPHLRAERHRRHVLAVSDRHVRDRRDAQRRDQLVEDLLDRERRLRSLRKRLRLQVHVGPEHEPGRVVELAGADQVVEQRLHQVLVRVQVLDHHHAAVGLHLEGRAEARAQQRQAATRQRRLRPPVADGQHVGVLRVLEHPAERVGLEGAVEPLLGLLGQLVLAAREAHEVGSVARHPAGVRGQRQVQRGDVAEAADDARVADRAPVDAVVQPRRAVAAAERVHHVDAGLAQRPLQVGGALLVGAGQVAVHLAVVGAEHDLVAERLEVGGGLLDLRARLGRAGRGDHGDRGVLGQRRRLDAPAHPVLPTRPASIASAISSPVAWSEPSTSSMCTSATSSRESGPAASNQSATPVHWSRIA